MRKKRLLRVKSFRDTGGFIGTYGYYDHWSQRVRKLSLPLCCHTHVIQVKATKI